VSPVIVAGVMSGTSADGINVALARVQGRGFRSRLELLAHYQFPYPANIRRAVLAAMNARSASVADLSRLNFLLGELYADAIRTAQRRARLECELVGCHGQTLYHQGDSKLFLGRPIACTWQAGEAAVIAARLGVPVVSDFRPADMAAGGKGAPLVPFLDYILYRHRRYGRIVQNLGGIANLTAIPPRVAPEQVVAFDTGPGNMVIDAVAEHLFGEPYDRNGRLAARGEPLERVLQQLLRHPFFRQKPPKTAGREQFGREFVREVLRLCRRADENDAIATATALTARSIGMAVRKFALPLLHGETGKPARFLHPNTRKGGASWGPRFREFIVSGGGTENLTLMRMIREELAPLKMRVRSSDEFGLPSEAKEGAAFALLAYQTWRRMPGNVPSATGAKRTAVLGKLSYP
jgi:anhydro-N-acetylmuramic acid kinase